MYFYMIDRFLEACQEYGMERVMADIKLRYETALNSKKVIVDG